MGQLDRDWFGTLADLVDDIWMVFDEAKIELIKHDPEAGAHNDLTPEEIREVKWAMIGKLTDSLVSVTLRKPKGYRQS